MASVLVIEDEIVLGRQIARALESAGHEAVVAVSGQAGLEQLPIVAPEVVLLDLRLPDQSGLDVLRSIREVESSLPVILMTAFGSVTEAVEAMRSGAADYLQKPLDLEELRLLIQRMLERQRRERELAYHRSRDRAPNTEMVGDDPRLLSILEQARRLRRAELSPGQRPAILLTGETGTGKGLIARAIHDLLGDGPFLEINCTALPATLIEAELFGHERGTFTDAKTARTGLFQAAEGGTIFLDEIGHASPELQAKLLKVIEDRRIRRLGASKDRAVDVHVIAATNRDLDTAVAEGSFRADLLHRLRVLSFEVPPLRERENDVRLLARHFSEEIGRRYGRKARLGPAAENLLASYDWPGNVRELRNVIERAVLLASDDTLEASAFSIHAATAPDLRGDAPFSLPDGGIRLADLEKDLIRQALDRTQGNRTRAAELLGLTRDTLRYRLEKFDLE